MGGEEEVMKKKGSSTSTSLDPYLNGSTRALPEAPPAGYVPLALIGSIKEKGFSQEKKDERISVPPPRVIPFPIARHRSHGPHWAPARFQQHVEKDEDVGAEHHGQMAQPLERKKKPTESLGKWKDHQKIASSNVTKSEGAKGSVAVKESRVQSDKMLDAGPLCKATQSDDMERIDAENRLALQSMSLAEIAEAQAELTERIRPELLEILRRRGKEKEIKRSQGDGRNSVQHVEKPESQKSHFTDEHRPEYNENPKSIPSASGLKENITDESTQEADSSIQKAGFSIEAPLSAIPSELSEDNMKKSNQDSSPEPANKTSTGLQDPWVARVEAVRSLKFDLDGNVVNVDHKPQGPMDCCEESEHVKWTVQNVAERDMLRTEGDPAAGGYSIKEAVALMRSMVPVQRALALRLIATVLDKASSYLSSIKGFQGVLTLSKEDNFVDWQAVWAYALGPEAELVLTLRVVIDDSYATVLTTGAKVQQSLLCCTANEHFFHLCDKLVFTAPIFRKRSSHENHFFGGDSWKYNAKRSQMFPFSKDQELEGDQTEGTTVGDDATIANQDIAAGLIRMGILPRIRYLLEVEKLPASEESLLSVVIALSAHSPHGADAVMKCPRLLETVLQTQISDHNIMYNKNENESRLTSRAKAFQLLKVLSQARKSNCTHFLSMGVFEAVQQDLLQAAASLHSEGHMRFSKSVCAQLIECTGFWKVCVEYGLFISSFADLYPALCFWVSAPSVEDLKFSNTSAEDFHLAQETFRLLEKLAITLPILHGTTTANDQDKLKPLTSDESSIWLWSVAIPFVESSFNWFSQSYISTLRQVMNNSNKDRNCDSFPMADTVAPFRALGSALHFLSTICEQIVEPVWLPTFVPQLGLKLCESGLLRYEMEYNGDGLLFLPRECDSFLACFLACRDRMDSELLLMASNILYGLIRLIKALDRVIACSKLSTPATSMESVHSMPDADKLLSHGLIKSSEKELLDLLLVLGNDVRKSSHEFGANQIGKRGGPAPGLGVGWGCSKGSFWSSSALVRQVNAGISFELLEVFKGRQDPLSEALSSSKETITSAWILDLCLGCIALAGPAEVELVEKLMSNVLLHVDSLKLLLAHSSFFLEKWDRKVQQIERLAINDKSVGSLVTCATDMRRCLLHHYKILWPQRKLKGAKVKRKDESLPSATVKQKYSPSLQTVQEDSVEDAEVKSIDISNESLSIEWAGQRLPFPPHWLLSPLSPTVLPSMKVETKCVEKSDNGEDEMVLLVKYGLHFLSGLEDLAQKTKEHCFGLCRISLAWKIHCLSTIFLLTDNLFLHHDVSMIIGALQEFFVHELDRTNKFSQYGCRKLIARKSENQETEENLEPQLDFEKVIDGRYSDFVEALANQFASVSFGDYVFGRQIAIYLRRIVTCSLRLKVWGILTEQQVLELLPSLDLCCGTAEGYFYPPEENEELLSAYVSSWANGSLVRARNCNSIAFSIALHHVAAFLFTERGEEKLLARHNFARSLVLALTNKTILKDSILQLLKYDLQYQSASSSCESSLPVSSEELQRRCIFFHEACKGFAGLSAMVSHLQKAAVL